MPLKISHLSICTGVHGFCEKTYRNPNNGWNTLDATNNSCFMAGFTIFHRIATKAEMIDTFEGLNTLV